MSFMDLAGTSPGSDNLVALAGLDQAVLDALPAAVYLCAGDGRVIRFNVKAVELWGCTPNLDDPEVRFCGSVRLYRPDGAFVPHDQCAMAVALQTGRSFCNEEVVVERPDGQRATVLVNIAPLKDKEGRVNGAINCLQDITDRKQTEERQRHLIEELNHRVKNTLATVQSMAANTARNATSIEDFTSNFEARLLALSEAHELLGESRWRGTKLRDLLVQQLKAFAGGNGPRVRFDGPEVDLKPQLALALSMIFHELMTNAAKYGCLSGPVGRISVEWDLLPVARDINKLTLRWVETDGPSVKVPQRRGFGTRLIERTITDELDGRVEFLFEPSGLQLMASIPLRK